MKNANPNELDSWENCYFNFVETLLDFVLSPIEQCVAKGNYNVAWELRAEGLTVDNLLNQKFIEFSNDQRAVMRNLSLALHALSPEAMLCGQTQEINLKGMANPEWQLVRDIAKELLIALAPRTLENRKFLNMEP